MITQTHNNNNLNIVLTFQEECCTEVNVNIIKKSSDIELRLTRRYWRDMVYDPESNYLDDEENAYIAGLVSKIFNIYPDANNIE